MRTRFGLAAVSTAVAAFGPVGALPAAQAQVRPRIMIAFDTSGTMALSMDSVFTFGDGVTDAADGTGCGSTAGIDTDCDGLPNDARIYKAKEALRNMVLAWGDDIDWALTRFHQDQSVDQLCPNINDWECVDTGGPTSPVIVSSIGNPQCNLGSTLPHSSCHDGYDFASRWPAACRPGTGGRPALRMWNASSPEVCINYEGTCTGGDVLVGWSDPPALLRWIDNTESASGTDLAARPDLATNPTGDYCNHRSGGNCELRPTGPTPLEGILAAAGDYMVAVRATDPDAACRPYSIILLTDGLETCGGDPEDQAAALLASDDILTYVVGINITTSGKTLLNAIATAGGTDAGSPGGDRAFFADDPDTLSEGLAEIVADSLLIEECNNLDDDCDGEIDEGFAKFCDLPGGINDSTLCEDPGETVCDGLDDNCNGTVDEGLLNDCGTCGAAPTEVCDGVDNDCDGVIDEGACSGCVPSVEACDGLDNDCDGLVDESLTRPCGTEVGECTTGSQTCSAGHWDTCSGVPATGELCDGLDNDCDGVTDGFAEDCGPPGVGICTPGSRVCTAGEWGACSGGVGPVDEICDGLDNDCDGETDEGNPGGGAACDTSCGPGEVTCSHGVLVCVSEEGAGIPEECNGLDDDCDGFVDEDIPAAGPCTHGGILCVPGEAHCIDGAWVCEGGAPPEPEICDCLDNDCDEETDEDVDCGAGATCLPAPDCRCARPCSDQEFSCPAGFRCTTPDHPTDGFCVPDACAEIECEPDELCDPESGLCYDPCGTVTCDGGYVCARGVCLEDNCNGFPARCSTGTFCVGGECLDDPCAEVSCASGDFCRDGECTASCAGVRCSTGWRCHDGLCERDLCADPRCDDGETCDPATGACIESLCGGVSCGRNAQCDPATGECEKSPCVGVQCPDGELCFRGDCYFPEEIAEGASPAIRVLAAGGGGCACGVLPGRERAGLGWLAISLVVGALVLRRRRARR